MKSKKVAAYTLIAGEFPASFAVRGCYRCVRLFPLVPTQLTSLNLVECGGRTIIGCVLGGFRSGWVSGRRAPPWAVLPLRGTAPGDAGGGREERG